MKYYDYISSVVYVYIYIYIAYVKYKDRYVKHDPSITSHLLLLGWYSTLWPTIGTHPRIGCRSGIPRIVVGL